MLSIKKSLLLIVLASSTTIGHAASHQATGDDATQFTRHKHLVEHVTSQGCAYCPWGDHVLELLAEMRDDIARVSIHNNLGASDQFRTFKADAIGNLLRYDAMPEAAFDRTPCDGVFMQVVSIQPEYAQDKAQALSDQLDSNVITPVLADVVIDAEYNEATRQLSVIVSGDVKSNFEATFGNTVGLTIYLTEDSLVAWQQDEATRVEDFVHNNDYLSSHQGEYAEAYSHYSPWVHRVDISYKHDFKLNIGNTKHMLQLSFDMKNVLNFFNSKWGVAKIANLDYSTSPSSSVQYSKILKYEGVDADGYATFSTPNTINGNAENWKPYHSLGQCWYASVGIKYFFN